MENEQTNLFTPLADEAFLSLGAEQVAYVKAINLPDGKHAIGIFSADGKPMAAAPSVELAQALIRQHDAQAVLADPLDIVRRVALGALGQAVKCTFELVEAQQQRRVEHRHTAHKTLLRGASGREPIQAFPYGESGEPAGRFKGGVCGRAGASLRHRHGHPGRLNLRPLDRPAEIPPDQKEQKR